tara:strand:- start:328 stop:558 length:231 start_codon:yes stop_codon:yes gene_type:complete
MKGSKQSKTDLLEKKVKALTNVVQQLIKELQTNTSLAQGTLTAFQLYIGKDEWEKIIKQLQEREQESKPKEKKLEL